MSNQPNNINQFISEYVLKIWFITGLVYAIILPTLEANNDGINFKFLSNINYWSFILIATIVILSWITFLIIGAVSVDKIISDQNIPIIIYSTIASIIVFTFKLETIISKHPL